MAIAAESNRRMAYLPPGTSWAWMTASIHASGASQSLCNDCAYRVFRFTGVSRATSSAARRRGTPASTSARTTSTAAVSSGSAADGLARPEHERDLALRRLGKPRRDLARRPPNDLLEALRQLAADRNRPLGLGRGEAAQRRRQALRRLERDGRVLPRRRAPPTAPRAPSGRAAGSRGTGTARRRGRSRRAPSRPPKARAARSRRPRRRAPPGSRRAPGSFTPGSPASLTSAIRSPASSRGSELRHARGLVVLVVAEQPRLDAVALEQDRASGACPRRARGRPRPARAAPGA